MAQRKKILITGAAGFTGRHLFALLSADGAHDVFGVDRTRGAEMNGPKFYSCDCESQSVISRLIAGLMPDEIYHLIGSYTNDLGEDYRSNVEITRHLLDAVRGHCPEIRVLLVGSSAEYGFPDLPDAGVSETHTLRPVSLYGLMKLFQTELMWAYVRLFGMGIVAVRPFNLSGEGISPRLFYGNIEKQIAEYKIGRRKYIETGNLSVERDYISVEDAVRYYALVMERGKKGEIYNVGSGTSISQRTIARRMLTAAGLSMELIREGRHEVVGKTIVPKIFADISKIKKLGQS